MVLSYKSWFCPNSILHDHSYPKVLIEQLSTKFTNTYIMASIQVSVCTLFWYDTVNDAWSTRQSNVQEPVSGDNVTIIWLYEVSYHFIKSRYQMIKNRPIADRSYYHINIKLYVMMTDERQNRRAPTNAQTLGRNNFLWLSRFRDTGLLYVIII